MVEHRRYSSLDDALKARNIPLENVPWIRQWAHHIGIAEYVDTSGYVKAVRAEPGPAIRFTYGWSAGFTSPEEITEALGEFAGPHLNIWPSQRSGLWGITHPVNRGHDSSERQSRAERKRPVCDSCFVELPETGVCPNCED